MKQIKAKLIIIAVLILSDVMFMPLFLRLLDFTAANGFSGISAWADYIKTYPFNGPKVLLLNEPIRQAWLWLQLGVFGLIVSILFYGQGLKKKKKQNDIGGPEAGGSGQGGTSRWRTEKEIEETLQSWVPEKEPLKKGGIVVSAGISKGTLKAWIDTNDSHVCGIGTTRRGKSRRLMLPTIWELAKAGESMILNDMKGELYEYSHQYLRRMGYDVVLLDFRNPLRGNYWNPLYPILKVLSTPGLSWVERDTYASAAAWDLANIITYCKEHKGDQIWPQTQETLLAALALAVAYEAPQNAKNMTTVMRFFTKLGKNKGKALRAFFNSLPENHIAKAPYDVIDLVTDPKLLSSIYIGASAALRLWTDPSINYLTSKQDHELDAPGRKKTAVFMVIPDEKDTRNVLASLYIGQTYQALVDLSNKCPGGRLPIRVNYLLDEFGNLPPVSQFDSKITVSAGRGIRYFLLLQDINQLKKRYGEDAARIILGNCHTTVFLGTRDQSTKEYISRETGTYTVHTESYSSNLQQNSNYSFGKSEGVMSRHLLTPDEVGRLAVDECLLFQLGQHPARMPLVDLSLWPAAQELIRDTTATMKSINEVPKTWLPYAVFDEEGDQADNSSTNEVDNILEELERL